MENNQFDVIIVGGGIVGLAAAYKINVKYPDKKVLVLEKEKEVGPHQTGHNSGVMPCLVRSHFFFLFKYQYLFIRVLVLEKEKEVGPHQTGHNSGVIHSGL